MDCVRRDMHALRITPEDAQERTFWKLRIRAADPTEEEEDSQPTIEAGNILAIKIGFTWPLDEGNI